MVSGMELELTRLQGIHDLDRALVDSQQQPLLLFKHSYTCGISAEALDELQAHIDESKSGGITFAMVTVQTHRDVAKAISERLGVRHETPQAILVREGRAVWSASHFRVNAAEIQKALAAASS
jgi:bacillithiol system protein YtxJ